MGTGCERQFTQTETEMEFKREKVVNLIRSKANSNLPKYFSFIRLAKIQKFDNMFCRLGYGKEASHTLLVAVQN